jgi:DsbC/DsbD-like thiol-disulfide interchange protein
MKSTHLQVLCRFDRLFKILALLSVFSIFFADHQGLAEVGLISDIVSVEYIHGWTENNYDIQGAIHFRLSPGWKTYWKNPGPLGVRPIFDWTQSHNIEKIEFLWPTPEIFEQYGVRTIGYKDYLTIPIKIIKINPVENLELKMNIEFGVCSDICLLKKAKIDIPEVPIGSPKNSKLINDAINSVPSKVIDQTISQYACVIQISDDNIILTFTAQLLQEPTAKPAMILEYTIAGLYPQDQKTTVKEQEISVEASLTNISNTMGIIERDQIRAILIMNDKGFQLNGCS